MFLIPNAAPISVNLIWSGGGWFGTIAAGAGVGAALILLGLAFGAWQRQAGSAWRAVGWTRPVNEAPRAAA